MSYEQKTTYCGKVIEVEKKKAVKSGGCKKLRSPKLQPTTAQQQERNKRRAERKLTQLLNTNYGEGDHHQILTYRKEARLKPREAKKALEKYMRKLRELYKKHGAELQYICVTEYKNKAIHHHLIINNAVPVKEINQLWTYGRPKYVQLDNTGQYKELAEYLIKETEKTFREPETPYKQRWNSSRNLKKPVIKKKIIKRNSWMQNPKPFKGYFVEKDSVYQCEQGDTGYIYQFYSMRMLEVERK